MGKKPKGGKRPQSGDIGTGIGRLSVAFAEFKAHLTSWSKETERHANSETLPEGRRGKMDGDREKGTR